MMDDPRRFLDQMSAGYQDAIILLAANHLGVFSALQAGPRTAVELAAVLGCDRRATDILCCSLVAAGLLEQPTPAHFALRDDLKPLLAPDGEESVHSILDHHYHLLASWVQLADVVRRGRPVQERSSARDDRALRAFICGMKDISRRSSQDVAAVLPELQRCRRLLDLGGGPGTSAITFCRRWPDLAAVVFDLPEVVPIAAAEIATAGLTDRITTRAGDYHTDPFLGPDEPRFDAVYVANIIHSLASDQTLALLTRAVEALAPGGLLVIKDFFLSDTRTEPAFGARFAVNMLVGTEGGKSYTWTETEEFCRVLGLVDLARHRVAAHSGVVTARRPDQR
jgi:predicted O-methyltransferase YrrM